MERRPGSPRSAAYGSGSPPTPTANARWKTAFAISSARDRLSSRLTRATREKCRPLRITTTAPTSDVTPRTCLPLMPRRMVRGLGTGDWGLGTGDRGLGTGDWGLGIADWGI